MGYITDYEVTASDEVINAVSEESGYTSWDYDTLGCCKWYYHEKHCLSVSKRYPNELITLKGVGEEYPDIWVKYFKNGKMQESRAKIVFDDFDEGKLK